MDEEKKQEKEQKESEETPTKDTDKGSKPETTSVIDRAIAERERMEKVLQDIKEENNRTENIMAKQMLAGKAEAGLGPVKTPEQTAEEYAKSALSGLLELKE